MFAGALRRFALRPAAAAEVACAVPRARSVPLVIRFLSTSAEQTASLSQTPTPEGSSVPPKSEEEKQVLAPKSVSDLSPKPKKIKNPIVTPFQAIDKLRVRTGKPKFDESLELALNLGIDPRKQDEQLRVVADLPHGTGRKVVVVAFTSDPAQANAAKAAGCDIVGGEELVNEILRTQQVNFDKAVATQEMLPTLAKVARLLGPRGLMPSKKLGSIVSDLAQAVERAKAGSVELRADRAGVVHCGFGKLSMSPESLIDNLRAVILCVENNKPSGVKGKKWVKSAFISSTMGPSHPLNLIYIDPKNPRFMAKE